MFALVLGAVRARTAQVWTVLMLTALATAAAVAGPWFGMAAATRAAAADVAAAPAAQRTLSVRQLVGTTGQPRASLDSFANAVSGILTIRDGAPVLGMRQAMSISWSGTDQEIVVGYRDGFCEHVKLTGACPAARGETVLSVRTAQQLGAQIGDPITVAATPGAGPLELRLVGTYELADSTGAYWSNPLFRASGGMDPLFTPLATFEDRKLWSPAVTYDVGVPDALLRGDNGYRLGPQLQIADARLSAGTFHLVNATPPLLETIARDKWTIRLGVTVALGEVLVLGWFAIGLTGRYTGRDRRGDVALLKLRGSTRLGMLRLTVGQHLVPLLGGAIVGAPIGYLLAVLLAVLPPMPGPTDGMENPGAVLLPTPGPTDGMENPGPFGAVPLGQAFALSGLAVAAVLVGGLLVLIAVEAGVLWQPVAALLRRVPAGRRDWRAGVVDVVLIAVAVAAVYQARTGGSDNSLGLLAPVLVALAVALALARLLVRIADRAGGVAVRRGRLGFGLTAVQASRQPGTDRVFALIVVAVALFATAAGGWTAGRQARTERGIVELGAARVLTVAADNRTELEYAVRRADPAGRYAMAAVVDLASDPPVLAVDSSRLAAVASWRGEYGPVNALRDAVAAVPVPAALPPVTGDRLALRAENAGKAAVDLVAVLQNEATGASVPVTLGPIGVGEHTVEAAVAGCAPAPGCRLVRFEVATPPRTGGPPVGAPAHADVTIHGLSQQNPAADILDAGSLADISRWRSGVVGDGVDLTAIDGTLTLRIDQTIPPAAVLGNQVFAVDAPLPVPVVLAGPQPLPWQTNDASVFSFGGGTNPVRVVGTAGVLPALGAKGMLVDLDTVRRVAADANAGGTFQVWLTADAPESIVAALRTAGLNLIGEDSVRARSARLAAQGSAVSARFGLLCAAIALLLAAAAVAVAAAVDRGPQADHLQSLRTQGLPRRTAVAVAYSGQVALVLAGLAGGLVAAAVANPLARVSAPRFTDGWQVIGLPDALGPGALGAAGLIALVVLGLVCWLSARPLARRLRAGAR